MYLRGQQEEGKEHLLGKHEIIKIKARHITFNFLCLESSSRSLMRQVYDLRSSDALIETGLVGAQ